VVSNRATDSDGADASCLDELTIAALAEGTVSPAERTSALSHLSECGACRLQLADVVATIADPGIAGELTRTAPPAVLRRSNVARLARFATRSRSHRKPVDQRSFVRMPGQSG
jgi:hypothetical protein